MNIYEFADVIDETLEVIRFSNQNNRFMAHFKHCDVKQGSFLVGEHGNSNNNNPIDAINDYSREISNKTIVFEAYRNDRKEYAVPKLEPVII